VSASSSFFQYEETVDLRVAQRRVGGKVAVTFSTHSRTSSVDRWLRGRGRCTPYRAGWRFSSPVGHSSMSKLTKTQTFAAPVPESNTASLM